MKPKHQSKNFIWSIFVVFSLILGFFIGQKFSLGNSPIHFLLPSTKIEAVLDYIAETYVDSISTNDLVEKAIPTMIEQLDPHSSYIPAQEMELISQELEGHFSGIGVQFSIYQDSILVVSVIPGGPSAAAGILPGDRIIKVNDSAFVGDKITNDMVFKNLRGPKGSTVKLSIQRPSQEDSLEISLRRDDIPINTVDASFLLTEAIGYIKVNRFGATTYREFITALSKLKVNNTNSLIIDLRGNSGGYLHIAQQMINEFFPADQLIVYTEGRNFPRESFYADGSGTFQKEQVIILIDEGSASASEIFAGTFQDTDRGLILGRRSFGKGLVQQQHDFADGSALRLTIARYYTPSGRCIQKAYNMGEQDEYGMDLVNRYLRGEMEHADSIKHNQEDLPIFQTSSGRSIYGNDGIMPDIFIPRNNAGTNSYYNQIASAGYIYEYAISYADKNRSKLQEFSNSKDLIKFLEQQPLIENIAQYAYQKGVKQRPRLLYQSSNRIRTDLIFYIIQQFTDANDYYRYIMEQDPAIIKAVSLLEQNKATPAAIASESYQEQKKG